MQASERQEEPTTEDTLARLRRLEREATSGIWRAEDDALIETVEESPRAVGGCERYEDADLIAAVRNALPALLDVAEVLRTALRGECGMPPKDCPIPWHSLARSALVALNGEESSGG